MSQRTKPMPGTGKQAKEKSANKQKKKDDEINQADDEIEDIVVPDVPQSNGLIDKIHRVFEKLACNRVGQILYEQCDRALKVVEDTARWSLPQDENDIKLERPLPWIFFLSLIVWLRLFTFWFNVGSAIVGTSGITPQSMVYSIQITRRRLRAIRVRGLKAIRSQEQEESSAMRSSSAKPPTLIAKVRQLFGSAICRPGQHRDVPARRVIARGDNANKAANEKPSEGSSTKRPRDDESFDLNLTVDQILNKYANDDSEDDSDYVPNVEDDDDDGSVSTSSMSSEEETEKENAEKFSESTENTSTDIDPVDHSIVEVKENGVLRHRPMPKPIVDIKIEPISDVDSGNEQVKTPQEPESSDKIDDHCSGKQTTEVDPNRSREQLNTPPQQQQCKLCVTLDEGAQKKSTPGHESAASLKPILSATTAAAPKTKPPTSEPKDIPTSSSKYYRTITTQTCIEYDWSIVVKTEISHRQQPVQLPKLDCSVQTLTPASSTEDIFYSPIGSPQDFHSIFHPAPLIKVHPLEVHSAPKENVDDNVSSVPEAPEWRQPHQRKHIQPNQNKQHHQQNYQTKNRNKNRR